MFDKIYNKIKEVSGEEKALQYAQIIPLTVHYVQAEDKDEASSTVFAELDYVCGLDSNLMAFEYDPKTIEEENEAQV